ncbi:hypothetical protein [Gemmatimonas sp.]|uniref:hypothetical protein n=1 Tax=Gemmatimonas sp. TaxID=1962908 RepID=UPI003983C50C
MPEISVFTLDHAVAAVFATDSAVFAMRYDLALGAHDPAAVDIAYSTFPGEEGRGIATAMAAPLL